MFISSVEQERKYWSIYKRLKEIYDSLSDDSEVIVVGDVNWHIGVQPL